MKKVKMLITSFVVLAIVSSAFAFNAKKIGRFCVSLNNGQTCYIIPAFKRTTGTGTTLKYVPDWDGASCEPPCPPMVTGTFKND